MDGIKHKALWLLLVLPGLAMAANTEVLGDAQQATSEGAGLFASGIILVLLALWIVPIIIGFMVYNSRKKKAEQAHEDMGLATAGMVLAVVITAYGAVYFFEGAVGIAMSKNGANTYAQGVKEIISPVLNYGMGKITGQGN